MNQDIKEKVKTFEDALNIYDKNNGLSDIESLILNYNVDDNIIISIQANFQIRIIAAVLNESWVPDWTNNAQYKWYPYFNMSPFKYEGCRYGYWTKISNSGSFVCFHSGELATYAGMTFTEIYRRANTL